MMNFYTMLQRRASKGQPVKVGVIGAGKFSTMFFSQARLVPGLQVMGIGELEPQKAFDALARTGWDDGIAENAESADLINDAAARGRIGVCPSAMEVIASDCEVILEITGDPEHGTQHALAAIEAGKHIVMVTVVGDLRWGVYIILRAPNAYVEGCFRDYGMKTDATGRYSALYRPYHYIGLELGISVASAALRNESTGTSLDFVADVTATAKKDLQPGDVLDGEGGYTIFGKLIGAKESLARGCLPLGLSGGAKVARPVAKGEHLTYADVSLDPSGAAYKLRKQMEIGEVG